MPITDANIQAALFGNAGAPPQNLPINKASIANATAGFLMSLWRATGTPTQGAIPGAAAICTASLTGAIPRVAAGGGRHQHIAGLVAAPSINASRLWIVDRLGHMGGLSGTVTTEQAVNLDISGTDNNLPNRRGAADYSEVQWFIEIYTDIGTTAVNYTVRYTRADGTADQTTAQFEQIGSTTNSRNRAGRLIPIIAANGDRIRAVQGITLAASTGTAGSFGVTALRNLCSINMGSVGSGNDRDWFGLGAPRVHDEACLALTHMPASTSTGTVVGDLLIIEG